MKLLCLILLLCVFVAALIMTYIVKREEQSSIGNKFLKLIRKFDSWQMMR
jgi:hypothetical protein